MKRIRLAVIAMLVLFCLTGTGCSKNLPDSFPNEVVDIDYTLDSSDIIEDRVENVNFYFDNIENTAAIDYQATFSLVFEHAVVSTHRSSFREKLFKLELKNEEYVVVEDDRVFENVCNLESFYINTSTKAARQGNGILNTLFAEDETLVNMNELNVIFTDLSEMNIDTAALNIRKQLQANPSCGACFIAFPMYVRDDFNSFYVHSGNNSMLEVNSQDKVSKRYYYLVLVGPTTKIAAYLHVLQANLDNDAATGYSYTVSEFNYNQYSLDLDDLHLGQPQESRLEELSNSDMTLDSKDKQESLEPSDPQVDSVISNDEMFLSHTLRLVASDDVKNRGILHFLYRKNQTYGIQLDPRGYCGNQYSGYLGNTYDFSYSISLDFVNSLDEYEVHYITTTEKYDGTLIYEDLPKLSKMGERDVYYSLGTLEEFQCYYISGKEWEEMPSERIERFFKHISVEGGKLNVISNNTDEGGIGEVYMTVPVYQVVLRKNCVSNAIDKLAYVPGNENSSADRLSKTFNIRQFYCNLYDVDSENSEDHYYTDETIVERSQIGTINVLITDI